MALNQQRLRQFLAQGVCMYQSRGEIHTINSSQQPSQSLEPHIVAVWTVRKLKRDLEIARMPDYPADAEYALLSRDGSFVQGFYKHQLTHYNDGSRKWVLYHKSSLPCWSPSHYTFERLCSLMEPQGLQVVAITDQKPMP